MMRILAAALSTILLALTSCESPSFIPDDGGYMASFYFTASEVGTSPGTPEHVLNELLRYKLIDLDLWFYYNAEAADPDHRQLVVGTSGELKQPIPPLGWEMIPNGTWAVNDQYIIIKTTLTDSANPDNIIEVQISLPRIEAQQAIDLLQARPRDIEIDSTHIEINGITAGGVLAEGEWDGEHVDVSTDIDISVVRRLSLIS